jgi:hypothetical protein
VLVGAAWSLESRPDSATAAWAAQTTGITAMGHTRGMETTLVAIALLLLAGVLAGIGLAGITERLPRNRWIGLRTAKIRHDDEAWRVGHRAAGAALIAAAGPPLLVGVALIAAPPDELEDWWLALAALGLVTGGLLALALRQAKRALDASDAGPPEPA